MTAPLSTTPGAVYKRERARVLGSRTAHGRVSTAPVPCAFCRATDARDAAHAQGCPTLPALSRGELVAIARNVERGWDGGKTRLGLRAPEWRDRTGIAMRARGAEA